MIRIMVDVESDGPIQGTHSMISFGMVVVEEGLKRKFYATLKPIGDSYDKDALAVSGFTREETLSFQDPEVAMKKMEKWLKEINPTNDRLSFYSDNNGYDFPWVNWYSLVFLGKNPFGHSSNNLRNIFNGYKKDMRESFKYLRETKHTHNALDDAIGNAEAMLKMAKMGIKGL